MKICIIGAGMTGITLAKELKDTLILEKSRGVGGRLAARRLKGHSINHGPLEFNTILDPHAWIKSKAQGLDIKLSWEVSRIEVFSDKIIVHPIDNKTPIECSKIIFTLPAPQVKMILHRSDIWVNFLSEVKYRSLVQFMILASRNCNLKELHSYMNLKHQIELENNLLLTLYELKDIFTDIFLSYDKEDIKAFFSSKISDEVIETHAHKWRYSEVTQSIDPKYQFHLIDKNIILAGDYFGMNGIESSLASVRNVLQKSPS